MGILDKFLKRKDPLESELGGPLPPHDPYGQQYPAMDQSMPPYPSFQDQPQQQFQQDPMSGFERVQPNYPAPPSPSSQNVSEISILKDLELISVKLDAIKSELDSVNQRLKRIERLAEEPSSPQRKDAWTY